jgi:hypothetical protein
MEDVLKSKGLYWITLGKGNKLIGLEKKSNWGNKNDETHGLIRISISPCLRVSPSTN